MQYAGARVAGFPASSGLTLSPLLFKLRSLSFRFVGYGSITNLCREY